ncbi:MAG: oligopeptide/dipeptide ABC transporter ATP-binding protein [Myxococcales bacterium]
MNRPFAPSPLLSIDGLRVDYAVRGGRARVLRGVDVEVSRGETLAVVGESGCGKSTLGRAAMRLVDPVAGRIRWGGTDVTDLPPSRLRPLRRRLQVVFQDSHGALDPRMTVGDQVAEALIVHGLALRCELSARVAALLGQAGLPSELRQRLPSELSGGQRQRACLARALAVEPELLILDEPVSALDVSVQAQVMNLLAELQRERGLAYVFITHDLRLVRHLADRVAVFYFGRIVEEAPVGELFARPRHPYTRLLLASLSEMRAGEPSPEPGVEAALPSPLAPPRGCPFQPRCPAAFDRCAREEPDLVRLGAGGARAACFSAERDEAGGAAPVTP